MVAFSLSAQYDIKGKVTNENGEPLIGASVFLTESQYATITDEQGRFEFLQLPVDIYELKVTYVGYSAYIQDVELANDYDLDIMMKGGILNIDKIEITANTLNEKSPFSYTEMNKEDVQLENLGQDLPFLLEQTPSVVVTSDAGAGIGYTGIRVRGSDATRVNVTINGVPLNDSESHGVFWVNLPDIASSVDNIQIQRGVGPSTNGAGAFGATVGLKTNYIYQNPFVEASGSYGSFNTKRMSVKFGTGLINDKYTIEGRYSKITSDGYIDRATSDLNSFYFSAAKIEENHSLRINVFSGNERTYQSWYGTPESKANGDIEELTNHYNRNKGGAYEVAGDSINLFDSGRSYNYYTYANQVDDYAQTHAQFIYNAKTSEKMNINITGHYTRGKGFFEQLKRDQEYADYLFGPLILTGNDSVFSGDLVRRKWLDNHFYGVIANAQYQVNDDLEILVGAGANRYDGGHYGRPVFAFVRDTFRVLDPALRDVENDPPFNYYENNGKKDDINLFAKANYQINDKLSLFADAQIRNLNYSANGKDDDQSIINIDQTHTFFNPKFGVNYKLNDNSGVYASFSRSNREPVRSDFVDAKGTDIPSPESLNDIEVGYRFNTESTSFSANVYLMDYKDQLVVTGALNDVGGAVRQNVDKSQRIGIELTGGVRLSDKFKVTANATLSQNKINNFTESIIDYFDYSIVENSFDDTDIALSPNIISAAKLTYSPIENLSINWLAKYVGDQFLDNTSNDQRKLKGYFVNDIIIGYQSTISGINKFEIKLMINNVLNTKYLSNGYSFNYLYAGDLTVENYLYPQAGTNFLVGASLSF